MDKVVFYLDDATHRRDHRRAVQRALDPSAWLT